MSKLKQRLGLKKQGSKTLTNADSSPNPSNLYPMAAGGHHPGNPRMQGQSPSSDPTTAHSGQAPSPHDPAYSGSGDLQEDHLAMAGHRSAANEEAEEQAMMELAIKAGLCTESVRILHSRLQQWTGHDRMAPCTCAHAHLHDPFPDVLCTAFCLSLHLTSWRLSLIRTCTGYSMMLPQAICAPLD